jgi:hypothetical protein
VTTPEQESNSNQIDLDTADAQKMFAEAYASASGQKVEPEPAQVVTPEPATPAAETVEAVTKEPEPQKVEVKTPETATPEKVETTASTAKTDLSVPDWAKDLPVDLQQKLSKEVQEKLYYQHQAKSEAGRQSALQKRLFDTRRELEQLRTQIKQPQDPALAAAAKQDQAKTLAEWNALKEADPSLANAIEARLGLETIQTKADLERRVDATVNPLIQHTEQGYVEEQRKLLMDQVPNYVEVVNSPVYAYWFNNKAPNGIKNLAASSVDAADALTVMQVYSQAAESTYREMVQRGLMKEEPVVHQAAPVQVTPETTANADKVAQARAQKIVAAPVVQNASNPIAVAPTAPFANNRPGGQIDIDDPAVRAMFEAEYKKNQRAR